MDWKEMIKNFRLVDLQINLKDLIKGKQVGIVNIYKENNYNINMPHEMMEKIINIKIDEAFEKRAKQMAIEHLSPIGHAMDLLPEATVASVVASTMATTTLEVSSVEVTLIGENVKLKIN